MRRLATRDLCGDTTFISLILISMTTSGGGDTMRPWADRLLEQGARTTDTPASLNYTPSYDTRFVYTQYR